MAQSAPPCGECITICVLALTVSAVQSNPAGDQHGHIELSENAFKGGKPAGGPSKRNNISESRCRKHPQAEIQKERQEGGIWVGWVHGECFPLPDPKRTRVHGLHHHKQEGPRQPHQKVDAQRPADSVSRHCLIAQHCNKDDHRGEDEEECASTIADEQQHAVFADIRCPPEANCGKAEYASDEGNPPLTAACIDARKEGYEQKHG